MRIEAGNTRHPGFDDGAREWGRIARSLLLAAGLLVSTAALAAADGNANAGVRLAGHVLPVLAAATSLAPGSLAQDGLIATEQAQPLSLTLVLRRDDEAGFRQYLHDVYDPQSPIFRQFLSQTEPSAVGADACRDDRDRRHRRGLAGEVHPLGPGEEARPETDPVGGDSGGHTTTLPFLRRHTGANRYPSCRRRMDPGFRRGGEMVSRVEVGSSLTPSF